VSFRRRAAGLAQLTAAVATPRAPAAAQEAAAARRERVERRLMPRVVIRGEPVPQTPLADRMAYYGVPAVTVAVLDSGTIAWAHAWGMADVATGRPATTATLFQAASISKPVAATAALILVERGALDLDTDVNRYLTSWQIPPADAQAGEAVTIRRLLSHTAGLTVHGFPGYARSATLPSAADVLDGKGNTAPVRVDLEPGSRWRYSGGGYTVLQLLLGDVTAKPFADLMRELVLDPAGMRASTYEQPLPRSRWPETATGYGPGGAPVEESWHVYPEQAAAGLWTTPSDLARWGLAILGALEGRAGALLSKDMALRMVEPGLNNQGLGPGIGPVGRWFGHGGANEGFRCQLVVFRDGRGAAVMTNSDRGGDLAPEILATLADEYGWPDFRAVEKTVVPVAAPVLAGLAGRYLVTGSPVELTLTVEAGRLYAEAATVLPRTELLAESPTAFFTRDQGLAFRFETAGDTVTAVTVMGRRAVRQR
jgi:CubicO group peptidase (beta-lactamase class C family)